MTQSQLGRLTGLEDYFTERTIQKLHSCLTFTLTLSPFPTNDQWVTALHHAISEIYRLRCGVHEGQEGKFIDLITNNTSDGQSIKSKDVLEYVPWESTSREQLNHIYKNLHFIVDGKHVMWKLYILEKSNEAILALNHSLFDGLSAIKIWNTILEGLNLNDIYNIEKDVLYPAIDNLSDYKYYHPYDDLPVSLSLKLKSRIAKSMIYWAPGFLGPDKKLIKYNGYDMSNGLLNDSKRWKWNLNPQRLKFYLDHCKKNDVTFTSYLATAIMISSNSLPQEYIDGDLIKISVPINTRNFCKETVKNCTDDDLKVGNFITATSLPYTLHSKKDDMFWELAKEVQKTLKSESQENLMKNIEEIQLLDRVDIPALIKAQLGNKYQTNTFEITNTGYQDFSNSGKFKVADIDFSLPEIFSCASVFSMVSIKDLGLRCSFAYSARIEPAIRPFLNKLTSILQATEDEIVQD